MASAFIARKNGAQGDVGAYIMTDPAGGRCWPAGLDIGRRWPFRLVATAEDTQQDRGQPATGRPKIRGG